MSATLFAEDGQVKIDAEFKSLIPALTAEEYAQLELNVIRDGCRDPLVLWDGFLIDGHNRYQICKQYKIGFATVAMEFESREDVKAWIIRNQFGRRNLVPFVRGQLALQLEAIIAAKAKANCVVGGEMFGRGQEKGLENSPNPIEPVNTREEVAKLAGVSDNTIARIKVLEKKASPKQKENLLTGKASINEVYVDIKRAEKEEKREQKREENRILVAQTPPIITTPEETKTYQTIVIDPPWDWKDEGDHDQIGRARPTYETMSIEAIADLPVDKLAEKNAHLYLWITNRSLPKGFQLLEKWGFRYILSLTWCKPSFGMGNYFRGATEHILFGVKGSLPLLRNDVGTWFAAPRPERHSQKPEEFYKLVETCSPGPWLEMFSRTPRNGWVVWGAEV